MQHQEFVIIGDGIAAKVLAFYLYRQYQRPITLIANDQFAPKCSTRTTAINCLRGTQKGLSPLGDMLVAGHYDFEDFYQNYAPEGIEKTIELQLWQNNHEKWLRRFGECKSYDEVPFFTRPLTRQFEECFEGHQSEAYIFHPESFLAWLDSQYERNFINDYVVSIEEGDQYILNTHNGEKICCDKLFICTSYESSLFSHLVKDEGVKRQLNHSRPVAGTYLRFKVSDFDLKEFRTQHSFSVVFDQIHFIFRSHAKDILIGSTSTNNSKNFLADRQGMLSQYQRVMEILANVITLPTFEKGELITGIRHKGQRRTPYWGEINKNCYAVWGLYKNGYSLAFSAAKHITNLTAKKCII